MIPLCKVYNFASVDSTAWFLMISSLVTIESYKTPPPPHVMSIILHLWTSKITYFIKGYFCFNVYDGITNFQNSCIPYKNEIRFMVFGDSYEDNLLPKFNLFAILDGIAQFHVSSLKLLCQVYWVTWCWFFVYWNITMNSIVINSYPMLAFKLSAILDALAL